MSQKEEQKKYRTVAPDIDMLLRYFHRNDFNAKESRPEVFSAAQGIFAELADLAPLKTNSEVKTVWLRIPRGDISDYTPFEEMKEWGEVETPEEYAALWEEEYPDEYKWYELTAAESFSKDGTLRYYGLTVDRYPVVSASPEERGFPGSYGFGEEEAAVELCGLLLPAVRESMRLLREGVYNSLVEKELPYPFRVGVIPRRTVWEKDPERKRFDLDGLSGEAVAEFKALIGSGANDPARLKKIKRFTANDFFRACRTGYLAIGKDCRGYSLPELYRKYSDGRDEGLTGKGHGLNAGPGVDPDSPEEWDAWFFDHDRRGGHPWEVVRGGNSTHMDLFVQHDRTDLEWDLRAGRITQAEYDEKMQSAGYYFVIAGMHRQFEAVTFFLALTKAGYPVSISGADAMLARFEADDCIGIVPHDHPTRYCASLFPKEYGKITDFMHADREDKWFDAVKWLPEEPAVLKDCGTQD